MRRQSRRSFIANAAASSTLAIGVHSFALAEEKPRAKVERVGVGSIGLRYQGSVIVHKAQMYGDIVGVCDVDANVRDTAKSAFGSTPVGVEDYRDLLKRDDIDVVTIGTPDHWHTKMIVDAEVSQ